MYVLKGFVVNANYVDNTVGHVATMGELSPQGMTYSKEKGFYKNDTISPDITLISFTSATDAVAQPVDANVRDRVLAINKWIWDQTNKGVQIYADQLLNQILTQFQSTASNFQCGNIIADGNSHWIPEWVSWTDNALTQAGTQNLIKMWFVDASFQSQFDDFSITVVPPLDNLDDFFQTGAKVEQLIKARDYPTAISKLNDARNGFPESVLVAETFNYIDPNNPAHTVPTNWSLLIYGANGNNVDSIADALVAYILANSTHSRAEWVQILPDLFRRTEVILIPLRDQYAIPDRALKTGIYATISNLTRVNALFKQLVPSYPPAHIDSHLSLFANPYKNLQIACVGGTENRNNWYELGQIFPDLLAVSSTSTDFGRMSQDTQGFLLQLAVMLDATETMGPFTDIPHGMTRVTRDGVLYLVLNYQNVHYLVAAKMNLQQVIPPVTP
jgi:hypothetical protein